MINQEELPNDWRNTDFENKIKVHDWKNYVPEKFILNSNWEPSLTERERMIIASLCEERAQNEEWD